MTLVRNEKLLTMLSDFVVKISSCTFICSKEVFLNRVKDLFNMIEGLGRSVLILAVT